MEFHRDGTYKHLPTHVSLSYDLYSVLDSHKAHNKQTKNTISA